MMDCAEEKEGKVDIQEEIQPKTQPETREATQPGNRAILPEITTEDLIFMIGEASIKERQLIKYIKQLSGG